MGGGGGTGVDQLMKRSMVFTALFKKVVKQFLKKTKIFSFNDVITTNISVVT